jgi:phage terminase large subunit-like protein
MVVPSQRHRHSDVWQPHQPFTLSFFNGAIIYIKGGKESGSSRGPNVNWFWYDEGGRDETGVAWQVTNAGVRIGDNPQAWTTATPRPTEHWMYKFFIEKKIPQDVLDELERLGISDTILIESWHATREDNIQNLDHMYYANLGLNYPSGWLRSQEYDGDFSNEGGKIGDRTWFNGKILSDAPTIGRKVRFWDLAATEKKKASDDPDETVGTLLSKFMFKNNEHLKVDLLADYYTKDNYCIEHQVCGFWEWKKLLEAIANTARHDGPYVKIVIEQEPGSGGKNQLAAIQDYIKSIPELAHHKVTGQLARDVGDRVMAANHWFGIASEGRLWITRGSWNEHFLSQLDGFTQILHDDCITSTTGAMTELSPFHSWSRVPFLSV